MSTGKTNLTSTQFAAKKLLGKAQTSNLKSDVNEIIPSNVSMPSEGIFAEAIPNNPGTAFYNLYSASAGGPATVERVFFDVVSISDTIYDANDTGGGGDEASGNGPHGYYLQLPSNYQTTSSNPQRGTGSFINGTRVYNTRGGLQLIPPLISNASPNNYVMKIFKGDPSNGANEITSGDSIDWQVDYYAGTIFIQDYDASKIPVTASAYLYTGKFLDEKISNLSSSIGSGSGISNVVEDTTPQLGGNLDVNGRDIVSVSNGDIELDPNGSGKVIFKGNATKGAGQFVLNCENNSHGIIIKGPPHSAGASYTLTLPNNDGDANQFLKTDGSGITSWANAISYSRTAVTASITASVNDVILGVSGTAAIQIQLQSAANYSSGQNFTVKDESGAADLKNITILASGSETIDGRTSIILQSPHAAVNIYSDGTSKFFIY